MDAISPRGFQALGRRPRLLDLYCGAGMVSRGYAAAGWDVMGVDIEPQPRYPFPFLQADATKVARMLGYFDAIHASPPCLRDTVMKHAKGAKGDQHPELIIPTRLMLLASGKPYVIENVEGAALLHPVTLCGSMFSLGCTTSDGTRYHLERHRLFEANWPLAAPCDCEHRQPVVGVYGGHVRNRSAGHGGRGTKDFVGEDKPALMRQAMGVPSDFNQTMGEMSQAVPPAYTKWVGRMLLGHVLTLEGAARERQ